MGGGGSSLYTSVKMGEVNLSVVYNLLQEAHLILLIFFVISETYFLTSSSVIGSSDKLTLSGDSFDELRLEKNLRRLSRVGFISAVFDC